MGAEDAPMAWAAGRFSTLGWGMLALATGGLFALMRLWVSSLRTELGLRMAVGATRRRLMALVLGRTTAVGAAGIAVGLWFGPALWGGLRDLLPKLPTWHPATLLGYALLLMFAALAGAVGPAWHAVRMPPAELFASDGG
jgi:ABC-type antimicrobial peptide transport system permease subunit